MKYCEKCGTQLSDEAKFCPKCGNPTGSKQADGVDSENSSNYCIELLSAGSASLQVVKVIKEALNLSLKDAKDYVDSIPCVIKTGLSLSEAKELAQIIEASGAKTNVKQGVKSTLNYSHGHKDNINPNNHIIQESGSQKSLSKLTKIALGFAGLIALTGIGGFAEGKWIAGLISLCALAAICCVFMGVIEKKYAWITAICSILIVVFAIGSSGESKVRFKKFEAVEDGRAAYAIDSAHYEKSDVQKISKIIMYEGNGRKDCKAEGVNGEGQLFTIDGKWEKKNLGNTSKYYYYLDYKYFKLLIREDSLICYYKGDNDNVTSIENAWGEKIIGKIKALTQDAENKISAETEKKKKEIEKEKKAELNKLLGNYYYSTYIGDTNAQEYYTITLNADGTFDFKPSNEQTKKWMELRTLVDGYEYPDGGKWEYKETVVGNAIFLDFDGNWDGSIALDNMVLEIKNMNGYNLKTKVKH